MLTDNSATPGRTRVAPLLLLLVACAAIPVACFMYPMHVIRPFRPEQPAALARALTIRGAGPWISILCLLLAAVATWLCWQRTRRVFPRIVAVLLICLTAGGVWLTRVNIFEIMFKPYAAPAFGSPATASLDPDDKVLAVSIAGESHAYPVRAMGYHHIVNDTVGGVPLAATYCTLCHTGLVWKRMMDGHELHFRLAGINNGNALIRDRETNTIWQQSTGQAIFGRWKGRQLDLVSSDELTFALWKKEQPAGQVLVPDAPYAREYDKNWEPEVLRSPIVVNTAASGIPGHELMLGLTAGSETKAYPLRALLANRLITDSIGGKQILIVEGPDNASFRVFQLPAPVQGATYVRSADGTGFTNEQTRATWDFSGQPLNANATALAEIDSHQTYWFDWMNHHPTTKVYRG